MIISAFEDAKQTVKDVEDARHHSFGGGVDRAHAKLQQDIEMERLKLGGANNPVFKTYLQNVQSELQKAGLLPELAFVTSKPQNSLHDAVTALPQKIGSAIHGAPPRYSFPLHVQADHPSVKFQTPAFNAHHSQSDFDVFLKDKKTDCPPLVINCAGNTFKAPDVTSAPPAPSGPIGEKPSITTFDEKIKNYRFPSAPLNLGDTQLQKSDTTSKTTPTHCDVYIIHQK